jgi:hypothetical protein
MEASDYTAKPTRLDTVHLFVDLANLWCGARDAAARHREPKHLLRLSAEGLFRTMAVGRTVASATLVANDAVPDEALSHFRRYFRVERVENGRWSGAEQAADETLQNRLLLMALRPATVGTMVVATGDGAGWRVGLGFCPALVVVRRRGLGIEVLAFESSLNSSLRRLAEATGVVVDLERQYHSITFLEAGRPVGMPQPRATSAAHAWSEGEQRAIWALTSRRAA